MARKPSNVSVARRVNNWMRSVGIGSSATRAARMRTARRNDARRKSMGGAGG